MYSLLYYIFVSFLKLHYTYLSYIILYDTISYYTMLYYVKSVSISFEILRIFYLSWVYEIAVVIYIYIVQNISILILYRISPFINLCRTCSLFFTLHWISPFIYLHQCYVVTIDCKNSLSHSEYACVICQYALSKSKYALSSFCFIYLPGSYITMIIFR